ncbi:hypothetical protein [Bosea sp. (in: a-proteobacteria)]|jgi:hypothetical protein|uniref:hypothetical protein n=1 Tax=Bosea sp. (in: a-proteobacteria) TaxID=1871050 RepID=UPI003F6F18A7
MQPSITPNSHVSDNAHWRSEAAEVDWLLNFASVEALLLQRHLVSRKYNPSQPRVPAGNSDGGQWTSGGGGSGSGSPFFDLGFGFEATGGGEATTDTTTTVDSTGEETWSSFTEDFRDDGSLAERQIVNRDGSSIQSEFAASRETNARDERHTVTLPDGEKTTFETSDQTQTIRTGGPDGEVLSRALWTPNGPEPDATVQQTFAPAILFAPGAAQTTITTALTLYTWFSTRNRVDDLQAVLGFNAREYAPGTTSLEPSFVGQLKPDEVERACPRFPEVRSRTDDAVTVAGPRSNYPSDAVYGTAVHTNLKFQIDDLRDPYFRAERSFLKSAKEGADDRGVRYGTRDSLRVDVFEQLPDGTICVYDIKTGKSGLLPGRSMEIAAAVRRYFGSVRRIIVTEVRPSR